MSRKSVNDTYRAWIKDFFNLQFKSYKSRVAIGEFMQEGALTAFTLI